MIGDAYFDKKDYLLAAESYAAFIKLHPFSHRLDYAFYRRGVALFKESPKAIDRDQQYLSEAIENLAVVIRRYPNSAYREPALKYYREARLRLAKRNMYVGHFYFRTGEYKSCIPRLKEVATQYRDTGLAPEALYMLTVANLKLDDKDGARTTFSAMSTEYPEGSWTPSASWSTPENSTSNKRTTTTRRLTCCECWRKPTGMPTSST
jgi:outer membrane protein assembly factor BamD